MPASTSSIARPPATKRPISSSGRCVAESPIRCGATEQSASSRSTEIARWEPRLVPATACTSSRISVSTERERLARLRGEHQVQRLRRRDQDVGRLLEQLAPLLRRRVARADGDAQLRLEPGERAAQVPLDVVVEGLERRDVEHAQALPRRRVEPVDRREERGQRLAGSRRRLDQDVRTRGDRRPAELLRRRRRLERALEPAAGRRRERVERPHSGSVLAATSVRAGRARPPRRPRRARPPSPGAPP